MTEQACHKDGITTVVIGIGNILLKDDGIGIHLINALREAALPPSVKLVDGGTTTLDLLDYFLDYDSLVILDALRGGKKPGTLYRLTPEEVAGFAMKNLSLHDVQVLDVIDMAGMFDRRPNITIYGIEPAEITYGLEMSRELQEALPGLVAHLLDDLSQ